MQGDQISVFDQCPRCGYRSYEVLRTHSFCFNCNFSPDFGQVELFAIPAWALEAISKNQQDDETAFQPEPCAVA